MGTFNAVVEGLLVVDDSTPGQQVYRLVELDVPLQENIRTLHNRLHKPIFPNRFTLYGRASSDAGSINLMIEKGSIKGSEHEIPSLEGGIGVLVSDEAEIVESNRRIYIPRAIYFKDGRLFFDYEVLRHNPDYTGRTILRFLDDSVRMFRDEKFKEVYRKGLESIAAE